MAKTVGTAVGVVGGISKAIEGRRMQKNAMKAIENFEWQELENPFENQRVSTLGADLQREEMGRATATAVDSLRDAGTRAMAGLGRVQMQNNNTSRQIGAELDQQQIAIDKATAQYDTKIQDMIEKRQTDELAGLGQMMNVGMGMKYGGMADLYNIGMSMGNGFGGGQGGQTQGQQGTGGILSSLGGGADLSSLGGSLLSKFGGGIFM